MEFMTLSLPLDSEGEVRRGRTAKPSMAWNMRSRGRAGTRSVLVIVCGVTRLWKSVETLAIVGVSFYTAVGSVFPRAGGV